MCFFNYKHFFDSSCHFQCRFFFPMSVLYNVNLEGEEFDERDKKYIICIDPVGNNRSLNVVVAGLMGILKRREQLTTLKKVVCGHAFAW